jgi:hypothetical protein
VLPPDVLRQLRAFAERADRLAPGVLAGLYGVGSVALGDFRAPLGNIDAVAVSDREWDPAGVRVALRAAKELGRRHEPPRIALVTWAELAADPAAVTTPSAGGRRRLPTDELVNPMTWQVVRTAGVAVRGPEYPEVGTGELREWAGTRLTDWWRRWLRRNQARPGALWTRRATTEDVLEVARLSQIVSSGRVVSKLEAGELAIASEGPRFQRILKDAVGFRRGAKVSMYWGPFERKRDVLAFVAAAVERAAVPLV